MQKIAYFYLSCVTRINLGEHIHICILSGRKKCDKYAIIFICKFCYKDKLGQTYTCKLSGRKKCDKYAIIFICKLCYKDKGYKHTHIYMYIYMYIYIYIYIHIYICILSGRKKCDFTYIYV